MKYFILVIFSITQIFAKSDFYYGFITEDKKQLSSLYATNIDLAYKRLNYIKDLITHDKLGEALSQIITMRSQNKLNILKSKIELLYTEILYKLNKPKYILKGEKILQKAISESIINEDDLLEALKLMVDYKIKLGKIDEAIYYANSIIDSFKNPMSKAYGAIANAKIAMSKKHYKKAKNILYKVLVETNNIDVATLMADELFDLYIKIGDKKKARKLAKKVIDKNLNYYIKDNFKGFQKVLKLKKAGFIDLATKVMEALLYNAKDEKIIQKYKFELAKLYMSVPTRDVLDLFTAKELLKDIVRAKNSPYKTEAKMYLDEILMREGQIKPSKIAIKYKDNEDMQYKVLLQELLNLAKNKEYEKILRVKKIYNKIPPYITKRFGYKDIDEVLKEIEYDMLEYFYKAKKCKLLLESFKKVKFFVTQKFFNKHINDVELLKCLGEIIDKKEFEFIYKFFSNSKDGKTLLFLESLAINLGIIDRSYEISKKIDALNNKEISQEEFLNRFLIYSKLYNGLERFFFYVSNHLDFIKANENNPMIIDFYHEYYLYLLAKKEEDKAIKVLKKLYQLQYKFKAFVYSPFVEIELARWAKLDDDYKKALSFLKEGLKKARIITDKQKAQIYYEMALIYKILDKKNRFLDIKDKCKEIKSNNLYKKMCLELGSEVLSNATN